jgi:hypothetical protein
MLEKLDQGEHPDTHKEFWSDFKQDPVQMATPEPGVVDDAVDGVRGWMRKPGSILFVAGAGIVLSAFGVILLLRVIRRRRARSAMTAKFG